MRPRRLPDRTFPFDRPKPPPRRPNYGMIAGLLFCLAIYAWAVWNIVRVLP
jgi:hypothetical protein